MVGPVCAKVRVICGLSGACLVLTSGHRSRHDHVSETSLQIYLEAEQCSLEQLHYSPFCTHNFFAPDVQTQLIVRIHRLVLGEKLFCLFPLMLKRKFETPLFWGPEIIEALFPICFFMCDRR